MGSGSPDAVPKQEIEPRLSLTCVTFFYGWVLFVTKVCHSHGGDGCAFANGGLGGWNLAVFAAFSRICYISRAFRLSSRDGSRNTGVGDACSEVQGGSNCPYERFACTNSRFDITAMFPRGTYLTNMCLCSHPLLVFDPETGVYMIQEGFRPSANKKVQWILD
eukprot:1393905-Amorphochlora_amoeboformis.AAC.1